jgi:hypothetical protein
LREPYTPLPNEKHVTVVHFLSKISSVREYRLSRFLNTVLKTAPGRACLEVKDKNGHTPADVHREFIERIYARQRLLETSCMTPA